MYQVKFNFFKKNLEVYLFEGKEIHFEMTFL